jgi:hypothetical protein
MNDLNEQLGLNSLDETSFESNSDLIHQKPLFLLVLCILAFIGNGLSVIQGVLMYTMSGFYSKFFTMIKMSSDQDSVQLNLIEKLLSGIGWWAVAIFVGSIICLAGTLIMWRLIKYGYFLYVFGQLVALMGALYFFIFSISGPIQNGAVIFVVLISLVPFSFIIMFGINLKYLTK